MYTLSGRSSLLNVIFSIFAAAMRVNGQAEHMSDIMLV